MRSAGKGRSTHLDAHRGSKPRTRLYHETRVYHPDGFFNKKDYKNKSAVEAVTALPQSGIISWIG